MSAKIKGLGISREYIIKKATALALSYLVVTKKKKETPKERADKAKAKMIGDLACDIGGCQTDPLLKLLDQLTGLPVSESSKHSPGNTFEPTNKWCEANPGALMLRRDEKKISLCRGSGTRSFMFYVPDKSWGTDNFGDNYGLATKDQINKFFKEIPGNHVHYLFDVLMEK